MSDINKLDLPDFEKLSRNLLEGVPEDIAERARAFFLQSFIKQGFTDASFIPWPKHADSQTDHKLLSASLALRDSIKIKSATIDEVEISAGEGLPYAEIQNNGGTITVRVTKRMRKYFWAMYYKTGQSKYKFMALTNKEQFKIHIPKRQFIGESMQLNRKIDNIMIDYILKAEKQLKF